ncbi:MAG: DUF4177 domain-containing protein [Bacillota bacterium]|jgi:hypothetical protein|nr:DUF4177 domain-containing protein [Clostridia bacterium]
MEYKVELFKDVLIDRIKQINEKNAVILEKRLNDLAAEGWELVVTIPQHRDGWSVNPVFIFKRN